MKNIIIVLSFVASILIFASCSKDDDTFLPIAQNPVVNPNTNTGTQTSASLKIRVIDAWSQPVIGANVYLYNSQTDYLNKENAIMIMQTDNNGIVVFSNLQPIPYWYHVVKGQYTNKSSSHNTGISLTTGETFEKITQLRK